MDQPAPPVREIIPIPNPATPNSRAILWGCVGLAAVMEGIGLTLVFRNPAASFGNLIAGIVFLGLFNLFLLWVFLKIYFVTCFDGASHIVLDRTGFTAYLARRTPLTVRWDQPRRGFEIAFNPEIPGSSWSFQAELRRSWTPVTRLANTDGRFLLDEAARHGWPVERTTRPLGRSGARMEVYTAGR